MSARGGNIEDTAEALPPADWHLSAVSLAIHNAVSLWRQTMHCTRGKLCYPWLPCYY